ncbi:carboxylesterase/lipase family protein [Xanthomonas vasicola]|uniref:carboxylesterase/lipase family protein n=1 Tax=Xanthomonas vasicola TaxID=56459 RepID=UPI0001CC05D1|nr:carboxylesterase family protein [Xanthomonas vasicola]KFA33846.1 carboxylesterase [Xanthomonas vasicola pv. musacearum NCPPB 4384]AZR23819.1 carboxylesterase [Xanthomonas vasicola]AZR25789.1 carboxylesterase [Xanthomonas vasicola pv. arecae]AZR32219.1 carboxylesterase [Xanthomonas vasicola pv. musacearum NCPPB 4379]AZR35935.1 carboxylesterase [Xanthomonas vasicola]
MLHLSALLLASSYVFSASAFAVTPAAPPEVRTDHGAVRGQWQDDGSAVFRAIPFAAPPLGALRWRPPQPIAPWTQVRDATQAATPCVQPALGWNNAMAKRGTEDCLYVEVQTPKLHPAKPLPVFVWIHGGANVAGGADGHLPTNLVAQDMLVVTLQYRLGVLGFLSLPELSDGDNEAAGNVALLDQIAALRWVHDNIAQFGGDPARVTIAGQSAGGQDVGLLMLSPLARGLFSAAIEQSGTAGFGLPARSLEDNRALGVSIAKRAGIDDPATRLAQLRALPAEQLLKAAQGVDVPALDDDGYIWLQAVVDGRALPRAPAELLAAGAQAKVPLLIGYVVQELRYGGEEGAQKRVRRDYPDQADAILQTHRADIAQRAARQGNASMQLSTDLTFRCPAVTMAQRQAALGVPVWHYMFDTAVSGGQVTHSAELPFLFKNLPIGQPPVSLQRYWAAFVRHGNPNTKGLPAWPAFAPTHAGLQFDARGVHQIKDVRPGACAHLDLP